MAESRLGHGAKYQDTVIGTQIVLYATEFSGLSPKLTLVQDQECQTFNLKSAAYKFSILWLLEGGMAT